MCREFASILSNKSSYSLSAFRLWQTYIKAEFVVASRLRVLQELKRFRIIYLLFACWVDHLAHYLSSVTFPPTSLQENPPTSSRRKLFRFLFCVPLVVSIDLWLGVLMSCDWRTVTAAAARTSDGLGSGAAGSYAAPKNASAVT